MGEGSVLCEAQHPPHAKPKRVPSLLFGAHSASQRLLHAASRALLPLLAPYADHLPATERDLARSRCVSRPAGWRSRRCTARWATQC